MSCKYNWKTLKTNQKYKKFKNSYKIYWFDSLRPKEVRKYLNIF